MEPLTTVFEVTCDSNGEWTSNNTTVTELPDCLLGKPRKEKEELRNGYGYLKTRDTLLNLQRMAIMTENSG